MKKIIALSFLFAFILSVTVVVAQNPDVSLSSNEVDMFNGENQIIEVTVTNNENLPDTFSISVFPHSWNNVNIDVGDSILSLGSGESKTTKIYINALTEAQFGARTFTVTAASTKDSKIVANQTILLRINRRSPVSVVEVTTDKNSYKPEEEMTINSVVSNIGNIASEQYALRTTVSVDNKVIKTFDNFITTLPSQSKKTFTNRFAFPKGSKFGTYSVNSVLYNELGFTVSSRSKNVEVERIEKATQTSSIVSLGFLSTTTVITSRNDGNVPTDIKITTVVPFFARDLFLPEVTPTKVENVGGNLVYTWIVNGVLPGNEVRVRYQFIMWQVWILMLALAGIVFLAFRFVFTPTLIKTHRYSGPLTKDKEILVSLEMKNKSLMEIKDVVVRDFVPGIAKVVQKFESMKPIVREGPNGSELFWKFDSLRPGEERILAYRIKPVMDVVGTIRLPSATAIFSTRKKQRKTIVSGGISTRALISRAKK